MASEIAKYHLLSRVSCIFFSSSRDQKTVLASGMKKNRLRISNILWHQRYDKLKKSLDDFQVTLHIKWQKEESRKDALKHKSQLHFFPSQ